MSKFAILSIVIACPIIAGCGKNERNKSENGTVERTTTQSQPLAVPVGVSNSIASLDQTNEPEAVTNVSINAEGHITTMVFGKRSNFTTNSSDTNIVISRYDANGNRITN